MRTPWTQRTVKFSTNSLAYAALCSMTKRWRREPWGEIVTLSHTFLWDGILWE